MLPVVLAFTPYVKSLYGCKLTLPSANTAESLLCPEYPVLYLYEPTEEEKLGGTYYGDEGAKLYSSTSPYNLNEESSI
jgi:hypothetical protein